LGRACAAQRPRTRKARGGGGRGAGTAATGRGGEWARGPGGGQIAVRGIWAEGGTMRFNGPCRLFGSSPIGVEGTAARQSPGGGGGAKRAPKLHRRGHWRFTGGGGPAGRPRPGGTPSRPRAKKGGIPTAFWLKEKRGSRFTFRRGDEKKRLARPGGPFGEFPTMGSAGAGTDPFSSEMGGGGGPGEFSKPSIRAKKPPNGKHRPLYC